MADAWLSAGPTLAPLAMLTNEAAADLDACFDMRTAVVRPTERAKELLGSTFVLCGLRHDEAKLMELFRRLGMTLEDSTTYQWILRQGETRGRKLGQAEGRLGEAQRLIVKSARKQFGENSPVHEAALRNVIDPNRLERMHDRLSEATSWDDLLATP